MALAEPVFNPREKLAGRAVRRWRWSSTMAGPARRLGQRVATAERLIADAGRRRAGHPRLHRRKAQRRDRPLRCRGRPRPAARRRAAPGPDRPPRRLSPASPARWRRCPAPASPCLPTGSPRRATRRAFAALLGETPQACVWAMPDRLDAGRPDRRRERGRRLRAERRSRAAAIRRRAQVTAGAFDDKGRRIADATLDLRPGRRPPAPAR